MKFSCTYEYKHVTRRGIFVFTYSSVHAWCNIKTSSLGDDKLVKDFKKIVMRSETGLSPICLVLVQAIQSEAGGEAGEHGEGL